MEKSHASHLGIEACLRRARECIFWPRMNSDLKAYIQSCDLCQSMSVRQAAEPLQQWPKTGRPFERIGVDVMEYPARSYFLVTVDYFSNFIEVDKLPSPTSANIIAKLKPHMARYGIPDCG
jgi:hypothetical protein